MVNCQQLETQLNDLKQLLAANQDELKSLMNNNQTAVLNSLQTLNTRVDGVEKQLDENDNRIVKCEYKKCRMRKS